MAQAQPDAIFQTARRSAVLSAVVEQFIATAQPVGSSAIATLPGVEVSSATVRNEMSCLEEEGYLCQPHTSSGRVPTDKGYRFFVNALREGKPSLLAKDDHLVSNFFSDVPSEVEPLLEGTSELLITLTDCASVVVAPGGEVASIRSVQLVDLSEHVVLVVAVMSSGAIEKRTIEVDIKATPEVVTNASIRLANAVVGKTLAQLQPGTIADDRLLSAAIEALREASKTAETYIGGASRVAQSFGTVDSIRHILEVLDQQILVVSLFREVLERGMRVAIGGETGVETLSDCSVVVAPFAGRDANSGVIGVLGPTRMNYQQALSAVTVVSEHLGHALSEN